VRRTIAAQHDRFALHTPFRISRGVKTAADVVTVTIRQGDAIGRGEGVPYARYGESVEGVLAQVAGVRGAVEDGADAQALLSLLPPGAARNAVDCALWDVEARLTGRSVADVIGAPVSASIVSALTIAIDSPEAMARTAAAVAHAPLLKVKVDALDPAAQVRAVRGAAPDAVLIVDPNESWDEAVATAMRNVLIETRVALLEQPAASDADAWLKGFDAGAPVCADESIHVAGDLDALAGRYGVVNIKLDKAGGLTAALELAYAARARGFGLMTGCMVSSSLSIAPALHVAAMSDFVDLDGPLWLSEDRTGGVHDRRGMLEPPAPGFWGEA
jgi:L-alanine-DL-glutamate epimerase-like enolase superfamily enzyme